MLPGGTLTIPPGSAVVPAAVPSGVVGVVIVPRTLDVRAGPPWNVHGGVEFQAPWLSV